MPDVWLVPEPILSTKMRLALSRLRLKRRESDIEDEPAQQDPGTESARLHREQMRFGLISENIIVTSGT